MEQFLKWIHRVPISRIIVTALAIGIILNIPFFMYLSSQPTRTKSKAALEPTPIPTIVKHGPIPAEEPVIDGVLPMTGKVGDEVVLWGKNLGMFPIGGTIYIGSTQVSDVTLWNDKEIRFVLPDDVASGPVTLIIEPWTTMWNFPITIYDSATTTSVELIPGEIVVRNMPPDSRVNLWLDTENEPTSIINDSNALLLRSAVDNPEGKPFWIGMTGPDGEALPFWLMPELSVVE